MKRGVGTRRKMMMEKKKRVEGARWRTRRKRGKMEESWSEKGVDAGENYWNCFAFD